MKRIVLPLLSAAGLALCGGALEAAARGRPPSPPPIHGAPAVTATACKKAHVFLVQNGENGTTGTAAADKGPKAGDRREPRQPDQKGGKAPETVTPIKPFNPSEKIDADQAVDFPYDI